MVRNQLNNLDFTGDSGGKELLREMAAGKVQAGASWYLGGGFKYFQTYVFNVYPYLGKWSSLTSIFFSWVVRFSLLEAHITLER